MSARERPVRNLAAWGYQSDDTGTRVEIDVWTVNEPGEGIGPDDLKGNIAEVLKVAGNVAKVRYGGIDQVGYQYVDLSATNPGKETVFDATQPAFAGAARAIKSRRTEEGTFEEGTFESRAGSGVAGPSLSDCVHHGEEVVIPTAADAVREAAMSDKPMGSLELADEIESIARDPSSDEDEEPVETGPFDGFDNVIRIFPGSARSAKRYTVENGGLRPA